MNAPQSCVGKFGQHVNDEPLDTIADADADGDALDDTLGLMLDGVVLLDLLMDDEAMALEDALTVEELWLRDDEILAPIELGDTDEPNDDNELVWQHAMLTKKSGNPW